MLTRTRLLGLTAGLVLIGLGCTSGALSVNYYDDPPPPRHVTVVEVAPEHVCTPSCAHYYDGARYIVIREKHHHGPGCGHHYDGRCWVIGASKSRGPDVVEVHKAPATRVHPPPARVVQVPPRPGPANVYVLDRRGSKWVKIAKGHVHGPECGHVHFEGHWCMP